jgi:ribonuclease T1
MLRRTSLLGWAVAVLIALAIGLRWLPADLSWSQGRAQTAVTDFSQLPHEERQAIYDTVALIKAGGPFPYGKDGSVFSNREGRLPQQGSGYYHEYTVPTPDSPDRGARRIVSGRTGELYYTRDHYQTFLRID